MSTENNNTSKKYPGVSVMADCIVFRLVDDKICLLLVKRKSEPYKGCWALPGGFMEPDETVEAAAARELKEETGLHVDFWGQLKAYTAVDRDPRGRSVSIPFYTLLIHEEVEIKAGDDAEEAEWKYVEGLPDLAFDHTQMVEEALEKLALFVEFEKHRLDEFSEEERVQLTRNLEYTRSVFEEEHPKE
ncbi:MAG: NUDIX hydrolase [Odoribacter sp.]|nr:NUDIX hydrolase [Odoribacter sp.]